MLFHISCAPNRLREGLFGQVFLHIFEILPFLLENDIIPEWSIRAAHYGYSEDHLVIPGVLEPVKFEVSQRRIFIDLAGIRAENCYILGNDWLNLSNLWSRYFRIPERLNNQVGFDIDLQECLGLHYRGTDKQTASWDSNPVTQEEFAVIAEDLLRSRGDIKGIYVATDDPSFVGYLRARWKIPIFSQNAPSFHKASDPAEGYALKTDCAMRDCIALSRCSVVLKTSSALSGFAKILNPNLEIYRVAASKMFADIPYFPVAYIEPYHASSTQVQQIVARLMRDDWLFERRGREFKDRFSYRMRNVRIKY